MADLLDREERMSEEMDVLEGEKDLPAPLQIAYNNVQIAYVDFQKAVKAWEKAYEKHTKTR